MNTEDAENLISFSHYCNCGGYAREITVKAPNPHLYWCAQYKEWDEWWKALTEETRQLFLSKDI